MAHWVARQRLAHDVVSERDEDRAPII